MRKAKLPYRIVRPLAKVALTTNFRRIYFSNAQVIPKDKPVILAANHPSAFMEPCILAVLLPRPLHFLVRGDFFAKPLFEKMLRSLHMLPIFRMKDGGYKKLKDNFSTFDKCHSTLAEGKVIMILAEGSTKHEKRLRPLQKGTARLALGTLKKYPDLDLQIIPVGVNYSNSDQFRSEVMIEFGQPMKVQDYFDDLKGDSVLGIKKMTDDLRERLKKHVVIIDKKEDEKLVEQLFSINRNNFPSPAQPVVSKNNQLLKSEINIASKVNQMAEADKKVLAIKTDAYIENIKKIGLNDYAIAIGNEGTTKNWLVIILGFLPFLIGFIGNFIPLKLTDVVINKKVKAVEFRASVKIATAIVVYLLYFLILFFLLLFLGKYSLILLLLSFPFFGIYTLLYKDYFDKWKKLRTLKNIREDDLINLRASRNSILSGLRISD